MFVVGGSPTQIGGLRTLLPWPHPTLITPGHRLSVTAAIGPRTKKNTSLLDRSSVATRRSPIGLFMCLELLPTESRLRQSTAECQIANRACHGNKHSSTFHLCLIIIAFPPVIMSGILATQQSSSRCRVAATSWVNLFILHVDSATLGNQSAKL